MPKSEDDQLDIESFLAYEKDEETFRFEEETRQKLLELIETERELLP